MKSNAAFTRAQHLACIMLAVLAVSLAAGTASAKPAFDAHLLDIQHRWAEANYRTADDAQKKAFETLLDDARAFAAENDNRAEAHIWHGIVASSYAGVKGPFGAMSLAKEAREALLRAEALDADALDGSVYTSLGVLYYKVPGGLIGFGDKARAREYLTRALKANPDGIDPNYFYGEFLFEQKDYGAARDALIKAQHAPPRPDRRLADEGRKSEVAALLRKVEDKLARG